MNTRTIILSIACIAGLASGPSALKAGAASVPPIEWMTLPFLFIGSAIALFLVLAFQVALKNDKAFSRGWKLFAVGTVYAVASGLSAVGTAVLNSATGPPMCTVLVIGSGMALALMALKAAFASRLLSEA
ncbi:hypothetical protein [Roseateles sp. LYH14W]|uniref:Uncharacterized protein n=1 Tax=Pelomonas parva TaxID=3299032 RepID=A0ABW7F675_9BURK